jgi:hypothetical protein
MMIELFRRSNDRISDLWLASAFGALSLEYGEALGKAKIFLRSMEVNDSNLGGVVVEAAEWDRISRWVPFSLCGTNTSLYRSIRFSSHEEPAVAILGGTLRDFCLYQCLSRLRGGAVWLPPSLIDEPGYPALLYSTLMHLRSKVDSHEVALWSASLSEDELAARVQATGLTDSTVVGYKADRALNHRRFLLAQQSSPKPTAGQFLGNVLVGFIETPKPTGFSHPTEQRWIADIEVSGYLPPRHPHLAAQMVGVRGDTQDVRTTRQGWSYRCPHEGTYFGGQLDEVLIRPSLKILEVPDLLHRLGLGCGLRFAPSEKGAYAEDSISKFGSLEAAANFLREQMNRNLLDKFLSTERATPGVFDEGVYTQGRRYLDLVALEKIVASRSTAASLIDDLLEKHILHRGLVFQCQSCRNADWYSIGKVSDFFECTRCGRSQAYRREHWKQPDEPSWYYKLDEMVYQGYKNGMTVPILTNDYLRRNSSSFQFTAEEEVFEGEASEPLMEIDVCAVVDGRLLIGEAKTSSSVEVSAKDRRKTIEKYRDLAQKLRVHCVVFSTMALEWSTGTLADLKQAFAESTIELVTLTGKELL